VNLTSNQKPVLTFPNDYLAATMLAC